MVYCQECGEEQDGENVFCYNCGSRIIRPKHVKEDVKNTVFCPNCGKGQKSENAFCFSCGSEISRVKKIKPTPIVSEPKKQIKPSRPQLEAEQKPGSLRPFWFVLFIILVVGSAWIWYGSQQHRTTPTYSPPSGSERGRYVESTIRTSMPTTVERQVIIREVEKPDRDGDGYPDEIDEFPNDPLEYKDSDGDGVGDNSDVFPHDSNEWKDSDGDGFGDNSDAFPYDSSEWKDSDGDGYGDNSDKFPRDPTEWKDTDNDGHGDNSDAFPRDPTEWKDSDRDGYGDNKDEFPNDPTEWIDTDGDKVGDNKDKEPRNPKRWSGIDSDEDGLWDEEEEYDTLTNPYNADTDGDEALDGYDVHPLEPGISYPRTLEWSIVPRGTISEIIGINKKFSCTITINEDYIVSLGKMQHHISQDRVNDLIDANSRSMNQLVNCIETYSSEYDLDYYDKITVVIGLTRSLTYNFVKLGRIWDSNTPYWYQYPLQTIDKSSGVCVDSAILGVALLRKLGYDAYYIYVDPCKEGSNIGHAVVGLSINLPDGISATYVTNDGKRYYLADGTGGIEQGGLLPGIIGGIKFSDVWEKKVCKSPNARYTVY